MKILALDIGISTGCAVIEGDPCVRFPRVVETRVLLLEDLNLGLQHLDQVYKGFDAVVVEEPVIVAPTSTLGTELEKAIYTTRNLYPGAVKVRPGTWKTNLRIRHMHLRLDLGATKHEDDAARLGIYAMEHPAIVGLLTPSKGG
jgi:hypothetical protein